MTSSTYDNLFLSSTDNAYVKVTPFETGQMTTPAGTIIEGAQGCVAATSYRFFIHHPVLDIKLWFDMGISTDLSAYPESLHKFHAAFQPSPSKRTIIEDTLLAGSKPEDVKYVIASHAHWDHIRPLPDALRGATMVCGPGSHEEYSPGFPKDETSPFDGRIWDPSLRDFTVEELPPLSDKSRWASFGPFNHALDFFKDGSFYLIDAPGHLPGNLAGLARVRTTDGRNKMVLLGGDCAHCNTFTSWPSAPFGSGLMKTLGHSSFHKDTDAARSTIRKIANLKKIGGEDLLVWYAHSEYLEGLWDFDLKQEI